MFHSGFHGLAFVFLICKTANGPFAGSDDAADLPIVWILFFLAGFGEHLCNGRLLVCVEHRFAAAETSAGPSSCETGMSSFDDQVSFEFGQGSEDVKKEFAGGLCRVDVFMKRDQLDAAGFEFGGKFDQIF